MSLNEPPHKNFLRTPLVAMFDCAYLCIKIYLLNTHKYYRESLVKVLHVECGEIKCMQFFYFFAAVNFTHQRQILEKLFPIEFLTDKRLNCSNCA